jgi:hypothetical protein
MEELLDGVDIQRLKRTFNLSSKQEDFVRILLGTRDYRLEESMFRDKVKSKLSQSSAANFQYYVDSLRNMDIFSVYYDAMGRRIIQMSSTLNKIDVASSYPISNGEIKQAGGNEVRKAVVERKPMLHKEDIDTIGKEIVESLRISPNYRLEVSRLQKVIVDKFDISEVQFKKVLKTVMQSNDVVVYRSIEGSKSTRQVFIIISPAILPEASKQYHTSGVVIKGNEQKKDIKSLQVNFGLRNEDISAIADILKDFVGEIDPIKWIDDIVQEIIINIIDKKIVNTKLTMSKETWEKYQSLCSLSQVKGMEFESNLIDMLKGFIDKEFESRFIISQVSEIISKSNDLQALSKIKTFLESKLSNMENSIPTPSQW